VLIGDTLVGLRVSPTERRSDGSRMDFSRSSSCAAAKRNVYSAAKEFLREVEALKREHLSQRELREAARPRWTDAPVRPITSFHADSRYGGDLHRADMAWAVHAAARGLFQEQVEHAALCVSPDRREVRLYFQLLVDENFNSVAGWDFSASSPATFTIRLVWDRAKIHRDLRVAVLVEVMQWRQFYFRPYAPELNPVEYVWGYLKTNPLANLACPEVGLLAATGRRHARSLQHKPDLLRSFIRHSPLSLRLARTLLMQVSNSLVFGTTTTVSFSMRVRVLIAHALSHFRRFQCRLHRMAGRVRFHFRNEDQT
jgi:transposase